MKRNLILVILSICMLTACKKSEDLDIKTTEAIKRHFDDFYFKQNYKIDFVDIKIIERDSISLDSVHQMFLKGKLLSISNKISASLVDSNENRQNYITEAGETQEYRDYARELDGTIGDGNGIYINAYLKYTLTNLNTNIKENIILENHYFVLDKNFKVKSNSKIDIKKSFKQEREILEKYKNYK
nr:hypothetical protein [uncultured Flavobacterium sp.]